MIGKEILPSGVAVLTFDNPEKSVNAINNDFLIALDSLLSATIDDENVKGIILTSAKKDFVVGADLEMILHLTTAQEVVDAANKMHVLLRKVETCGKPVVVAINGTALGGGYELCLACHHRIAVNNTKTRIGLPEVQLGLLPGGGGTQRLPRLIGIQNALRPLLEGQKFNPEKALKLGLLDAIIDDEKTLIQKAEEWILETGNYVQPWDEKKFRIPGGGITSPANVMALAGTAGMLRKKTYGNYPAPFAILNAINEGLQLPFDQALQNEAKYFAKCVLSQEAKNMIKTLFFNLNDANKGIARPKNIPPSKIEKVGILGAGMMGAGIAYVTASAGLPVVLKDSTLEHAEKGKSYSEKLLAGKVEKGRMTEQKAAEILSRITPTADSTDVKGCDLVIEAVFENRELKATVTKESEAVMESEAVFASNTSTLPITGLAEASVRPENFIGLHFFSPVDKMPLVEIIVGEKTSDYAIAYCIDYVLKIKKTPIVVNDSRGFYTSRVFSSYIFEGLELLAEGVAPALIENAGKMAGMPVGPLAVADEVSIELCYKIKKQTEADTGIQNTTEAGKVIDLFVEKYERIGKKAGKGFYDYPKGEKKKLWKDLDTVFKPLDDQPDVEIVKKRLMYRQALEAIKCYEEGVLRSPQDADIGSILGWGVPPYTGGILSYVETTGIASFIQQCEQFASSYGERFKPTKSLLEMDRDGKTFYELRKKEAVS